MTCPAGGWESWLWFAGCQAARRRARDRLRDGEEALGLSGLLCGSRNRLSGEVAEPSPHVGDRVLELAERHRGALLQAPDAIGHGQVGNELR